VGLETGAEVLGRDELGMDSGSGGFGVPKRG